MEGDGDRNVREREPVARKRSALGVLGERFRSLRLSRETHKRFRRLGLGQICGEARPGVVLAQAEKRATLDVRHCHRRLAVFNEHRQHEVRPFARGGPLRRAALPTRIVLSQIVGADDAKHAIRLLEALLHPGRDVAACVNLPFMDMRRMAERLQLLADPERPLPVAACVADEDIRHARPPAVVDGALSSRELPCASIHARSHSAMARSFPRCQASLLRVRRLGADLNARPSLWRRAKLTIQFAIGSKCPKFVTA